jgi:hypothetical protein
MNLKITILVSVLLFSCAFAHAQSKKQLSVSGHYVLVPHNIQQGVGYSIGINHKLSGKLWLLTEYAYTQANRIRFDESKTDLFETYNLNYQSSGYHLAIIPQLKLPVFGKLSFGLGIGGVFSYQSHLYDQYNYKPEPTAASFDRIITGVDYRQGFCSGLVGSSYLEVGISDNWAMKLSGAYRLYYKGEDFFTAGLGISYCF